MLNFDADYQDIDPHKVTVNNIEGSFPAVTATILLKPEKIYVQSDPKNTGVIYLGVTGLLANGKNVIVALSPGSDMFLPHHTIATWKHISDLNGQNLFVSYMKRGY